MCNNLKSGYSRYNLLFLKKYSRDLNRNNNVLDVGAGHFRNLKLFYEVGFTKLYAIDKNIPDSKFNLKIKFILQDIENGLPYKNKEMDIVLCNYVLMFINKEKINFVLEELMRVCSNYLIIETYPKNCKTQNTEHKEYNFNSIYEYIKNKNDFEILDKRNCEKLMARRLLNAT